MPKQKIEEKKEAPQIQIVEEEAVPSRKRNWFQKLLGLNKTQAPSGTPPEF
jgi:hypothetical protein